MSQKDDSSSRWLAIKTISDNAFRQMSYDNRKSAAEKLRVNQEFGMAINLAIMLSELRLMLHYKILVEKMLEVSDKTYVSSLQRYHDMLADHRNPYPVTLPQPNQAPVEYQSAMLTDAKMFLAGLQDRLNDIQDSIIKNWGADNYVDGIKIQTAALHAELAAGIDTLDFLKVDEAIAANIEHIEPDKADQAREVFHEFNDHLQGFLEDRPPPSANYLMTKTVDIGEDVPEAPTIIDTLPLVKPKAKDGAAISFDAELFIVNELRQNAYQKIDPSIVGKAGVIQLAVKYKDAIGQQVKVLEDKAQKFVDDSELLKSVKNLKQSALQTVANIETELHMNMTPRLR